MGLTDRIEEQAEKTGAKAKELEKIKEEVEGLRGQIEGVSEEVDQALGENLEETQERLSEMIRLLKRALKSMKVMEETEEIMNAVRTLGDQAKDTQEEMSKVNWSRRVRTTVWQGVALGIALLLATSILWTSTTLPRVLTPVSLVLSEKEEEALSLGNRYRSSYNGLSKAQQQEVTALLKAGLQAREARKNPSGSSRSKSSQSEKSQDGSSQ
ncbi:hypothetical protein [Salinibacter altiplanensis]|uniref:hypothetical protein n=1 Tax=Salinibacter altiplanensis TaxID=1803181 RepID=UPI001F2F1117|nr:hypothetical protein [Salinibacter altiplanensis]